MKEDLHMQKICTGECPYIKDNHTININYTYVPMLGTLRKNYKKGSFNCSFFDECPYQNDCPVYQDSPVALIE